LRRWQRQNYKSKWSWLLDFLINCSIYFLQL